MRLADGPGRQHDRQELTPPMLRRDAQAEGKLPVLQTLGLAVDHADGQCGDAA